MNTKWYGLAASLIVNVAALGALQVSASRAHTAPEGVVSVTQLDEESLAAYVQAETLARVGL